MMGLIHRTGIHCGLLSMSLTISGSGSYSFGQDLRANVCSCDLSGLIKVP